MRETRLQVGQLDEAETSFFERIQPLISQTRLPFSLQRNLKRICGVDAAYDEEEKLVSASAVSIVNGSIKETSSYLGHFTFPYASGLFFLHEGPSVVAAVNKLKVKPGLVCFDAHGSAHPRSRGLATICGMVLGIPSIGIAKSALIGQVVPYRSGIDKLIDRSKVLGYVTQNNGAKGKRRLFWSPGYSVNLKALWTIIRLHRDVCIKAITEAHMLAKIGQ